MPILPASGIKRALVAIEGTKESMTCDLIDYQGMPWLVPEWIDAPLEGWTMPKWLVLAIFFQPMKTGQGDHQYILQLPVPQSLLDGRPSEKLGYNLIERPAIRFERLTVH